MNELITAIERTHSSERIIHPHIKSPSSRFCQITVNEVFDRI